MPSVAQKKPSVQSLQSYFPLTSPVPNPTTHRDLISTHDLHREEDLLRNPTSFRAWWTAIHSTRDAFVASQKAERTSDIPEQVTLLGPLATPLSRVSLQRLTYLYEAALAQFPSSFKLWKSYLIMRMSFVLGKPIIKKMAGGKKKFPEMKDALEDERDDLEQWESGLDPVVGWEEWKSLVTTFERALMWLPKVRGLVLALEFVFNIEHEILAATSMANVSFCIFPLQLSCLFVLYSCSSYVRPSIKDPSPVYTLTPVGAISIVGRTEGGHNNGLCLPTLPRSRS